MLSAEMDMAVAIALKSSTNVFLSSHLYSYYIIVIRVWFLYAFEFETFQHQRLTKANKVRQIPLIFKNLVQMPVVDTYALGPFVLHSSANILGLALL